MTSEHRATSLRSSTTSTLYKSFRGLGLSDILKPDLIMPFIRTVPLAHHLALYLHEVNLLRKIYWNCYRVPTFCQRGSNVNGGVEAPVSWKPPVFGRFKVNWDVALDTKNNCMGLGVIVRDHKGLIHAALSKTLNCLHPSAIAEAVGALRAAEFCCDLGLHNVVLEGDSLIVVQDILALASNWCAHGQIVADIRVVLNSRRSWMVMHTKRNVNQAAHGLAKHAVRNQMDRIWIEEIPSCISNIVVLEHSALSI
ncbi:uncharacterized protein LOC132163564 isoform X2 [Corylus avellana]|uniref:uncharacterized protein LOC132163564 isoform X2 n=1 Tax=Corylus avellana TaxID=13451 RepID=UPI00286A09C7|nr:uncharacterized protein LOC132163564 isoform X2 [Corylus avellana]